MSAPAYTLCSYWRSSASWRVRAALELKGIPYTYKAVHLVRDGGEQLKEGHRLLNPMAEVPTLLIAVDGKSKVLTQSLPICEYLDEVHPEPPLLPSRPFDRAAVRALCEVVNSGIHPVQNLKVLVEVERRFDLDKEAREAWAHDWIARGFEGLEVMLGRVAGRYAFGDTPTLADCFVVPQVYNALRFGVDLEPFPTIARVAREAEALPAFARAHPSAQPDAA